jgi:Fe-S-cluster containining protein
MPNLALMAVQARGKVRRFIQAKFLGQDTAALLAKRQGDCNRCGACCKILFQCPFLGTDAEGHYTCRIYDTRFEQCRLFPLRAADLLELEEQCSYTFVAEDAAPAVPARGPVEPTLAK